MAVIKDGVDAGGSYVFVQRWEHNLKQLNRMSVHDQEMMIGRTKEANEEIDGDERTLRVRRFRGGDAETYDFSDIAGQPFHAGADLQLIGDFIRALRDPSRPFLTTIDDSIESHRICYAAERSRRTGETIRMDAAE